MSSESEMYICCAVLRTLHNVHWCTKSFFINGNGFYLKTFFALFRITPASRTLGIFCNSQNEEFDGADNIDEIPPISPDEGGMQWDPSAMKMIDKVINELVVTFIL